MSCPNTMGWRWSAATSLFEGRMDGDPPAEEMVFVVCGEVVETLPFSIWRGLVFML